MSTTAGHATWKPFVESRRLALDMCGDLPSVGLLPSVLYRVLSAYVGV